MTDVVVITGGSRGIGAACARLAASRGYAVCLSYQSNAEAAQKVVGEIEAASGTAKAVAADVSTAEEFGYRTSRLQ